MPGEMEGADDNISINTITVEMTEERDGNSTMHVWPDYSTDVPIKENWYRKRA